MFWPRLVIFILYFFLSRQDTNSSSCHLFSPSCWNISLESLCPSNLCWFQVVKIKKVDICFANRLDCQYRQIYRKNITCSVVFRISSEVIRLLHCITFRSGYSFRLCDSGGRPRGCVRRNLKLRTAWSGQSRVGYTASWASRAKARSPSRTLGRAPLIHTGQSLENWLLFIFLSERSSEHPSGEKLEKI